MTELNVTITTYSKEHAVALGVKDDLIRDFPVEAAAMIADLKSYWKRNVGRYFSKSNDYPNPHSSHQLADACVVEAVKGTATAQATVVVELGQMFSPDGFEYGKVLMKGRSESKQYLYVPEIGKSIDTMHISYEVNPTSFQRTTRGTTSDAWNSWKKEFNAYVRERSIQFVKQCIKKGLIRRTR